MKEFDIIAFISEILAPLNVPVVEGWFDKILNITHITVHEFLDEDNGFEDDLNSEIIHNIQIDIWSMDSLKAFNLKNKVKTILKKNDFIYDSGQDFYETKKRLYHKGMRFIYTEFV
ncbi:hypothetical protein [Clostridium botulinum]|uniref:hypothetical protein n=1 Tax=Clostridium botulinum TaxID=1491 RepID=UPI0006994D18|nr:hypothetical protein [Clostridium botulinum]KOA90872.1 hypothetical protein ADU76_12520 [Clostridium botulinum]MCD3203435.1 hypothetical protein [Clostridium botulinum C/D]MCD3222298.1 hypothetical protein [Clostridium botulinum C/D]MCD3231431.1 hypothetical protein [Clostridium botulinum C/D]MCD3273071.1 hypothetical protein [Clostridium botulinum C/D]